MSNRYFKVLEYENVRHVAYSFVGFNVVMVQKPNLD